MHFTAEKDLAAEAECSRDTSAGLEAIPMSEPGTTKDLSREDALRILGGWAMWSSPNEPDAELRSAARAVLHDRLALIQQLEELRVANATAAFERAKLQKYILGASPYKQTAMIRPIDSKGVNGDWRECNAGVVYLADDVDALP
jgi:hypothetical protein